MKNKTLLAAALLGLAAGAALAQDHVLYIGGAYIDINSKAPPLSGPASNTPHDARLEVDDARTLVFGYAHYFTDNIGLDLTLGIPPKHKVYGKGDLEGFGQISSSRQIAPTLFVNYRFGSKGDKLRPFVGAGINYTHFTDTKSTTSGDWASGGPTEIEMDDSWGLAGQVGLSYAFTEHWSLTGVVATAKVKSDMKATTTLPNGGGTVVRTTTIDFRPVVFMATVGYTF